MSEARKLEVAESYATDSRRWVGRILVAVVLGEAIWAFLVSIVNDLVLPAAERLIDGDSTLFRYVVKADFNFPGLLASLLELGFAVIVVVLVNSWLQPPEAKAAKPALLPKTPGPMPIAGPPANPSNSPLSASARVDVSAKKLQSELRSGQPPPQPPKAETPKKQKTVYYNIAGEPVDNDDS